MTNILNTSFSTLYVFAGMVLLEFIIFLIIVAKKKLNIIRILFAVLSGNLFTTVLCLFLPAGTSEFSYYTWMGISFLVAVVFEWLIDMAYFKNRENTLGWGYFLTCSVFGNLVSFALLGLFNHLELLD
ncbi:MAG: hypothetical protein MJZ61_05250 [Bacteroidales bacterium]|nr:hypothetical protein [Bacteroidales bacterium]